ncbi:YafY family protein [Curtobacterium sp. MCBD17_032]|uniref:helix-turn-helix transcriptional regulator n=1 Tax=Curtobacterium sp. MCBD17_032 TaxID=2175659 RepID=UPI000DA83447|nr:WYL domain-containing protein [Curtobacterium sp. MCBD17_032]PZE87152.1 transcriptional regulator [Curtobacterium sp. MCBD17_032]
MSGPSSRMLTLLSLLQVRRDWAGDVLADRLAVSPRTVRRDVDRLRELGYRITSLRGPAGGYRLAAGSELPPLLFDDDQAVAVALALAVAPASGADIADAAARALATVRQVMPSRLRHRIDTVEVVTAPGRTVVDPAVLVAVSDAVRSCQVLRFGYTSAWPADGVDDRPPRRVEPHAVVARAGRWYLLAWSPEADDWRTYRIDRMHPRTPTGPAFAPRPVPGGDAAAFVEARFRGADPGADGDVGHWPCIGTAVLHVPASTVTPYVDDDAVLEGLDAGSCRLTTGSWSWSALAARLAAFTVPFTVVGPEQLRTATTALADQLRAAVDTDRPSVR